MQNRKKPLKRSTKPLKRSWLKRKPGYRIPRVSKRRKRERAAYTPVRKEHLLAHPLCQLTIAKYRFDEAEVLAEFHLSLAHRFAVAPGVSGFTYNSIRIPCATQIHHRNKCVGTRLTDPRFFASAGSEMHDWVEDHKDEARADGYLLPLEADKEGRLPNGEQCLTTDEWISSRARQSGEP
jgi:hypothetical protein